MDNLVILPIILPLLMGIILVLMQKNMVAQRILAGAGSIGALMTAIYLAYKVKTDGILILQVGGWQAPFGISLVADAFATVMLVAANFVTVACLFYSFNYIGEERQRHYYYPFFFFLLTGVSGAFLTGDVFNLFVFFEVMLVSSYVLIVLGGTKPQLRESIKYVLVNLLSSVLFITAVAYLYSVTGTLNMADLAVKVKEAEQAGLLNAVAMLFFIVFAIKAALFPFYLWLPGAYSAPPAPVAALFGGLLTKVGVYSLIRIFTMIFTHNIELTHNFFIWVAGFTMVLGVLGAVATLDIRRILAYNVIASTGFIIMGLGIFTAASLAGAIYYMVHGIAIKAGLFLLAGATINVAGTSHLGKMSGLIKKHPALGWLFLTASLALVGIPPLGGFIGKLSLVMGGLAAGRYWIIGISLLVSLLILFSITRIFIYGFWGEAKLGMGEEYGTTKGLLLPATFLILVSVALGLGAGVTYPYVENAAQQLMDPSAYIRAVLGGS